MNQREILDPAVDHIDHIEIPVSKEHVGASRYSPAVSTGSYPAILMYIPYPKDDIITWGAYYPLIEFLAKNGYEVVVADMVGTGSSTGEIKEFFLRSEGKEGAEIVRWLADQTWTNGKVGMIGKSYGGITALDVAALNPDPLKAIIPIHAPYIGYRNGFTYQGLPELSYIWMQWLTNMQALAVKPPNISNTIDSQRERWEDRLATVRNTMPLLVQFNEHPQKDGYWKNKDIPVEEIEIPTLAVGGWRDSYTKDTIDYFDKLQGDKKLILGPWRHTMPHKGKEFKLNFRKISLNWFDKYLKERQVALPGSSNILYYNETVPSGGFWGEIDDWPSVNDESQGKTTLFLSEGGLISNPSKIQSFSEKYDYDYSVGLETATPLNVPVPSQKVCIDDQRSITYDSAPLKSSFDMLGSGNVKLRVSPTTSDLSIATRIEDVHPDGTTYLATKGALRGSCRKGIDSCEPLDPGQEYVFNISLQPKAYRFREGHKIRLAIATAQFPDRYPIGGSGSLELRSSMTNPAQVQLMGTTIDNSMGKYVNTDKLERKEEINNAAITSKNSSWKTFRDPISNQIGIELNKHIDLDLPYGSLTRKRQHTAKVERRNSNSLEVENHLSIELEFPKSSIQVLAKNMIEENEINLNTTVKENDQTIFDESWKVKNSILTFE